MPTHNHSPTPTDWASNRGTDAPIGLIDPNSYMMVPEVVQTTPLLVRQLGQRSKSRADGRGGESTGLKDGHN